MRRELIFLGVLACAAGHGAAWAQCALGSSSSTCQWRHDSYNYTSGTEESYSVSGTRYRFFRNPGATSNTLNSNIINQQRTRVRLHPSTENTNGLQMWLDASRGAPALTVSSVLSKLSSATVGGVQTPPTTTTMNGLTAWRFDTGTWMKPSRTANTSEFSAYWVGRVTGAGNILVLSSTQTTSKWSIRASASNSLSATVGSSSSNSLTVNANQPFVASLRYKDTTANFAVNTNSATFTSTGFQPDPSGFLVIGPQSGGQLDLGELRIFSRSLSDQEHTDLMKRLCQKWSISPC